MSVQVVTDSTAYLPVPLARELGVHVISLYYGFEEGPLRREVEGGWDAFYDELVAARSLARTSPPPVEDFIACYEPLLAAGDSVVSIHISSGISETCQVARRAAAQLAADGRGGDRIEVIDSASVVGQLGLVVLAAARAARTAPFDEVVARARLARQEGALRFLLDTLEFLRRGGRIGNAAALLGSALSIKPILTVESEIKAVDRVLTRDRAIERIVEYCRRRATAGADAWFIQHIAAEDDARLLSQRLQEIFWRPPEFVSAVGPVIGTHTGPGLLVTGSLPSGLLA
jgi:DegV family protein with EDD domain